MTELEHLATRGENADLCEIRFIDPKSGNIRVNLENRQQLQYLIQRLNDLIEAKRETKRFMGGEFDTVSKQGAY